MTTSAILYTIGHSNLSMPELLRALKDNRVLYIIDVRSSPRSQRYPYFDRPTLAAALGRVGIDYIYLGDKLGGKPPQTNSEAEWRQGKADPHIISKLSRTEHWANGIQRLATLVSQRAKKYESGCLLCSERDANNCHRLLIAFDVLNNLPDLTVNHIRPQIKGSKEVHFQKTLL